ncbi:MAG: translation initiation factor IF-2 [Bdellovibrionaceae bacterium]|nr:translation initiation factor IF-2 [Pseudobdellovibrionaceae bacterium]
MSNLKVFEYAKEVGMTPLALMDKIREWQLPVKSHMAELTPDLISQIQEKMNAKDAPAEPVKKTATRKKAATKAAPKAPKVTTVKAKAAAAAKEEPVEAKPKSSATVVRRKAKAVEEKADEVELQDDVVESVDDAPEVTPEVSAKTEDVPARALKTEVPAEAAAPVAAKPAPAVADVVPEAQVEARAPETARPAETAKPAAETAKPAATDAPAQAAETPAAAAAPTGTAAPTGPKIVARKKEVAIGQSGVASNVAASAPRRNIVGRMDLSRVQAPPGRPTPRGDGGGPSNFSRPTRPGEGGFAPRPKGNLRPGFIQQAPPPDLPPMGADDFRRRVDNRKRPGAGGATDPASAREKEEQPKTFDAAEFRKRELVFQPKKKKVGLSRPAQATVKTVAAAHKRVLKVEGGMKVGDMAQTMGLKATDLIKVLMKSGVMATINTVLDFDTIALIAPEFKWEAQSVLKTDQDLVAETAFGDLDAEPVVRPPVVTVMGHVDHGKTSLLDAIRQADVASGEAGGITQHIGAYQVSLEDGYKVTFLDTPGHAAFTAMRARGANVTDIAVIVVAADDGVMPQTAEAISHAKAAGVPMIVAVNKMDKPGANPDKIKQQLTEYEVVPEEWGGSTMFVNVSALKKTGIPELLEQIRLIAEVAELRANPMRSAKGAVIEAKIEKGRGPVATVLIQDGTIKVGQFIVAGTQTGRVRAIMNDKGERLEEAGPGMPVQIGGLGGTPQAGDKFDVVADEKTAEEVAGYRRDEAEKAARVTGKATLEQIFAKATRGDVKDLAVVLKADVAGSLEAIQGMFSKLSTPEVNVKIIHSAVGGISESDVLLASTTKGIIVGFNVRPDGAASQAAKSKGIELRTYSIVYELMDDMKRIMSGLLTPDVVEKVMGRAEVRNTFSVPKIGVIAGCFVSDGKIARSNLARLVRDGKIVFEGKISSLKRFKDDAREVATGFECGIGIENFNDIKVGDVIEAYTKEEVARSLEGPGAGAEA